MAAFTRYPITAAEILIVDEALEAVSAIRDNHSFYESELIDEVVKRAAGGGTDSDRRRRAERLIHAHNQRDTGQRLAFPGTPRRPAVPADLNPDIVTAMFDLNDRNMKPDDIDTMVMAHHPEISRPDLLRYWRFAIDYLNWRIAREEIECELFEAWDRQERAKGRPESELVFGNFITESGFLVVNEQ